MSASVETLRDLPTLTTIVDGIVTVKVVEDSRRRDSPLRRWLEIYDLGRLGAAVERLRGRLRLLESRSWTHILAPIESEWDDDAGELRVLYPEHGVPLAASGETWDSLRIEAALGQLVSGLEELRRAGIAHGGIQANAVLVADSQVKFAGVLAGPLAEWTSGEVLVGDVASYWPPEWKGTVRAATEGTDLYAATIVLAEAAAGESPEQPFHRSRKDAASVNLLLENLRAAGVSGKLRRSFAALLAADYAGRRSFLVDARGLLTPSEWGTAARVSVSALTALSILLLAAVIIRGKQNADLDDQLLTAHVAHEDLSERLGTQSRRNRELMSELARQSVMAQEQQRDAERLQIEIANLRNSAEANGNGSATETVAPNPPYAEWKRALDSLPPTHSPHWGKAVFESLRGIPTNGNSEFIAWKLRARGLIASPACRNWSSFETRDSEVLKVRKSLATAILEPWDQAKTDACRLQFEALELAAREWIELASQSELSWDQFKSVAKEHLGTSDAKTTAARDIMLGWFRAFETQTQWECQLLEALDPTEVTLEKRITLTGDIAGHFDHTWSVKTGSNYRTVPEALRTIEWKPGTAIEVYLTYHLGLLNVPYDLIDQTFGGPVALWNMHRTGVANWNEDEAAEATLSFSIVGCPGPPRDYAPDLDLFPLEVFSQ